MRADILGVDAEFELLGGRKLRFWLGLQRRGAGDFGTRAADRGKGSDIAARRGRRSRTTESRSVRERVRPLET